MFKIKILEVSNARSRLLLKNVVALLGVKGGLMIVSLLSVPILIYYLSKEQYGIWITLYSVVQWTSFLDIGLGNGLKNKLTIALAEDDFEKGKFYVSTTYACMMAIFSVVAVIGYILVPYISWYSLFNLSLTYQNVLVVTMRVLIVAFCLQMIFNTLTNVIYAYQLNFLSALLNLLSQILILLLIFFLFITFLPSLKIVAFCFGFIPVLVFGISSYFFYKRKFRKIAPSWKYVNFAYAKDIFTLGGNFFIIQFAFIVVYQTVNILISKIAGPIYVTQYNIAYQYLSVPVMLFSVFLSPLWPAVTDAYQRGDYVWMINVYNKMKKLFVFSLIVIIVMVLISPYVYDFWVGKDVGIQTQLTILVATYMVINIWNSFHSTILNGMGKVRIQIIFSVLGMFFTIPIAVWLGTLWGVYGILIAMVILSVPTAIISNIQIDKVLKHRADGYWNK